MSDERKTSGAPERHDYEGRENRPGFSGGADYPDNTVAWRGEYDEWENQLGQENPDHLEQLIRLPRQQYDEESGAVL